MKHIKWLILLTCFTSCLNLWANEKKSIAVAYPDTLICVNGNDSIVSTGFLLPTNKEQLYSICIPSSSNESYIGIQSEMLQEGTTSSSVAYDVKTYTVTVTSNGNNGYVSCSDTQIRNDTKTFTIEEGGNFTITAIPDEGYRVKSIYLEKDGFLGTTWTYTDRESISKSNTVYGIKTNVSYTVEFEKIPDVLPTYIITVISKGDNGYVSCVNDQVRNETKTYTADEGSNFTIIAIPDEGYRVKSIYLKKDGFLGTTWTYTDRESISKSNTVYGIKTNVSYIVEFEKIPDVLPTYIITVISKGDNGYVSCVNDQVRNETKTYTADEGSNFTITAIPDEGYRVKSINRVKDGFLGTTWTYTDRESISKSNTVYDIKTNVSYTVEFEKIYEEKTIYNIALSSNTEHGYISYSSDVIRNSTKKYHVEEGTDFSFRAIPDEGYRVKNIIRKMEGTEAETWSYSDNTSTEQTFTSYSISKNQSIEVNFEHIPGEMDNNIYLSIIQSDSNGTKLQVEEGEQIRLQIQATGNRSIQSVIYEGEDVTSQIVDGYFTTPPIYQNVVLHIIYEP